MELGKNLDQLMAQFPKPGIVVWIGIRLQKRVDLIEMNAVEALSNKGLKGDHYSGKDGKRHVTLIQYEHLLTVASILGRDHINPNSVRRNIVVKGINLLALKDKKFNVGTSVLEMTGLCHPCSRMEDVLGKGGYNAMRGHGGITARIVESGIIKVNDSVLFNA